MKVLGLILEINPFHNGHKYFIEEALKQESFDYVIAVVSTSFSMRGEVSVIDKFTKTSLLLDNNVDLVLELPIMKAVNSSDYFTYNAIEILAKIGVTDICFGSEAGDLTQLFKLNEITSSPSFNLDWKANIDKGLSYNQAATLALKENNLDEELINQYVLPNNTLALGYISAIKKLTQTPSLFSNQFESNNMIFKDDFSNFQLDNFSSLNNDLSITNNDISDLNNKKNPVSSNPNQEINNINNQNNFNNKNMNLNNNIFDRYINNEYEEINNQNNIDMTNNNLNINENSPFKNKLIISKKNGKIVIKSIPTKIDDEF